MGTSSPAKNKPEEMLLFIKIRLLGDLTCQAAGKLQGHFAHAYRDDLINTLHRVERLTQEANIPPRSEREYHRCLEKQNAVLGDLRMLEEMLQRAVRLRALSPKAIGEWSKTLVEVKKLFYGWKKVYPKTRVS